MHPGHLKNYIIIPALDDMGLVRYGKPEAVDLLMGTCAQESLMCTYVHQLGNGPARSIYQIEEDTYDDLYTNFIDYRTTLQDMLSTLLGEVKPDFKRIVYDLRCATIIARLIYYRVPAPIPKTLEGRGQYWKDHFNTTAGAGTTHDYIANYSRTQTQSRQIA